ncbi:copper uptake system-associated protein [Pseudotabrizicola sp. L79]|uniref:copper uptake system-associated protein n=1 Tax=Pseudotabrizicola sp. L79 TaxID=3118402 RepID=UPI002F92BB52
MNRALGLVAALLLAGTAFAHPGSAHEIVMGDLQIIHANIPAPAGRAQVAAGYMAISNEGDHPDSLIGVEVGFAAKAMLHTTDFSAEGVASMKHVQALEIPANDTVVLEPGGYHIMLMGLTQPLIVGDMLPATLIFEQAGRVQIEFMVDPADGSVDHSTMDHSSMGHGTPAPTAAADAEIGALLKAQFDTAETPLTVAPITVQGNVAIAGWAQGGRGGRAFLRQDDKGWFVELCSGASLMLPATLQSLGLSAPQAGALLASAKAAEAALAPETIALFDSFDGTMIIGRNGH